MDLRTCLSFILFLVALSRLMCTGNAAPASSKNATRKMKTHHRQENSTNSNSSLPASDVVDEEGSSEEGTDEETEESSESSTTESSSSGDSGVNDGNAEFEQVEAAADIPMDEGQSREAEEASFFEGDMASIDPNEASDVLDDNAIKGDRYRWPKATVPYVVSKDFSKDEMAKIKRAMEEYHKTTCIKWKARTNEKEYVYIQNSGIGCFSDVGRRGSMQAINYSQGCMTLGTLVHEMMHALGFFHEQSRADRDKFIKIHFENIVEGRTFNFDRKLPTDLVSLGADYDYGSVMHYGANAFSVDPKNPKKNTIEPMDQSVKIGQRDGFSGTDLFKLNKLYKC